MNKLYIILLFSLSTICYSCSSRTESHCSRFKNGKFSFRYRQSKGDIIFSIDRHDSTQIEKDEKTGQYSKLAIRWITECSYEARLLETTFPFSDSVINIRKTIPFETEIISTAKDYYIFKSHRGNAAPLADTMWIIQ